MAISRVANHPLAALQRLPQQFKRDLITPLVPEYVSPIVEGIVYPASAAEFLAGFGFSPASLYRFDGADGADDLVGSNDLTASGEIVVAEDEQLGGLCAQFALNETVGYDAASAAVFDDDGATSFAFVAALRVTGAGGEDGYAGKYPSTGNGYFFRTGGTGASDGKLRLIALDGGTKLVTTSQDDYDDGAAFVVAWGIDRSAATNELFIVSDRYARTEGGGSVGSCSNSTAFRAGSFYLNSMPHNLSMLAYLSGANAEGITQAHCAALKAAIGI